MTEQEKWERYEKDVKAWRVKYKNNLDSMQASMMRPNQPGYFRANND
jgi:hypothetical protein